MAKSPQLGRVKRRLGRDIGDVAATRFYRSCLSHIVMRVARDPRWRTVLAVDPDRAVAQNVWPARRSIVLLPQGEGFIIPKRNHMLSTGDPKFKTAAVKFLLAH